MRSVAFLLACVIMAGYGCAQKSIILKTDKERYSYTIGVELAEKQKKLSYDLLDAEAVSRGVFDEISENELLLTEQERKEAYRTFEEEKHKIIQAHEEEMRNLNEEIKRKGEKFLQENSKREEVVSLPSGLQYEVLREGSGKSPKPFDEVVVNYLMSLPDGTEIDSSEQHGGPVTYRVNFGIAGISEGLQLMKKGAKWRLYIPQELAYGEFGDGRFKIPPYSPLIYEVELLGIPGKIRKQK